MLTSIVSCAEPTKAGPAWEGVPTTSSAMETSNATTQGGTTSATTNAATSAAQTTSQDSNDSNDSNDSTTTDDSESDTVTTEDPGTSETSATTTGAPLPDPGAVIGTFTLTYYWLTEEAEFNGTPSETLYSPECDALATVDPAFADALTLEGTGRLTDGRVLNYWNNCGCANSPCFFEVGKDHPWGAGVENRPLVPFRSLAVDVDLIDIGDWVYVAEFDGLMMPGDPPWGGFVHDGCVIADDIGGGINGQHIDFFSALRTHYLTLDGELGLNDVTVHGPGERCGP